MKDQTTKKNSFILYHSYQKHLEDLSDAEVGQLTRAIFHYSETGEVPKLKPLLKMAFNFIREDIDINKEKYEEKCRKNKENIKKRWNKENTNVYDRIRSDTNYTDNDNVNDNVNDNDKYISKDMDLKIQTSSNNSFKKKKEYGNTDINKFIKGLNKYLQIKLPEDGRARRIAKNSLDLFTKYKKDGSVKEGREFLYDDKWENVKWFLSEYMEKKVKKGFSAQSWDTLYKNIKIWIANNGSLGDK